MHALDTGNQTDVADSSENNIAITKTNADKHLGKADLYGYYELAMELLMVGYHVLIKPESKCVST